MDREDLVSLIDDRLKSSLTSYKAEMISSMENVVSKISGSSNAEQLSKISGLLNHGHTFKRKSNEEQFKYNSKVSLALDEADKLLQLERIVESREKLTEARQLIAHSQKLIRLADSSELGWCVVNEYETNPLASDSDDEKRIYKAEARATKKLKAEKTKKGRMGRKWPYTKGQATATSTPASAQSQQSVRRPGLCFDCGKPGHWKGAVECQANASKNKISIDSYYVEQVKPLDTSIKDSSNTEVVSPAGRLKGRLDMWKMATDSIYIHSTIEHGYRLPFVKLPESVILRNNKSARDNMAFVLDEVHNLLSKEVISEVQNPPHVVNPLTVALNRKGKPRLVLDCRHINDYLHQFKVKFDDILVAESLFDKGTYMYTFDLKSAYHHVDIFREHRTYLGFSCIDNGVTKYFVYNQLPFGIKTAGHIFTKVLKVFVTFLRDKSHRVITFLDDGIGGDADYNVALISSDFTKKTLLEFGFLLAYDKCQWLPSRRVIWLGHVIDMHLNLLFITKERVNRLLNKIESIFTRIEKNPSSLILVRELANVVGQIISMQSVFGSIVRLMTRKLFNCINARASWNAPIVVTAEGRNELIFWKNNAESLNKTGKPIKSDILCKYSLFSDASSTGYGGYVVPTSNGDASEVTHVNESYVKSNVGTALERSYPVSEISSERDSVCSHVTPEAVIVYESTEGMVSSLIKAPEVAFGFTETPEVVTNKVSERTDMLRSSSIDKMLASEIAIVQKSNDGKCMQNLGNIAQVSRSSDTCSLLSNSKSVDYLPGSEMVGLWIDSERSLSSTWREAQSVYRLVFSNAKLIEDSAVKVYCDNKNVATVLKNGSRVNALHDIALNLHELCENENIVLHHEWIPRSQNDVADYLSRSYDCDDWEIHQNVFSFLNYRWGPFSVDRFASHLNAKCARFNSRWWVPGTEAIDCFVQSWQNDVNWVVPPPRLISRYIEKITRERAKCTLIITKWKSAVFWPLVADNTNGFKPFVTGFLNLGKRNVILPGRGNNGCFLKHPLAFDMLALRCNSDSSI